MSESSDRVSNWLQENAVPPKAISVISMMLTPAENLDVVDGELLVLNNEGTSQLASERFPDMGDLLVKGSVRTALQLHLEGRPLPTYRAPQQYQVFTPLDVKAAVAKHLTLTRVSAANG